MLPTEAQFSLTVGAEPGLPDITRLDCRPDCATRVPSPDINGDQAVNECDLIYLATDMGRFDRPRSDLSGNGLVDLADIAIFAGCACICDPFSASPPTGTMGTATIGVYFDAAGTVTSVNPSGPTVFDFWVIARNIPPSGIGSYAFGLTFSPGTSFLSADNAGGPGSLSYGSGGANFWRGHLDLCLTGDMAVLAHGTAFYLNGPVPTIDVVASTDCYAPSQQPAFTPCGGGCGWTYFAADPRNIATGVVFRDDDDDCVQDPGEPGLPGRTVLLDPGDLAATTNAIGRYVFSVPAPGQYTALAAPYPNWDVACPTGGTRTFDAAASQVVSGLDFGTVAIPGLHDLSISVGAGAARPGFTRIYSVTLRNLGSEVENPFTATLTLPPQVVYSGSSDGGVYDTQANTITWSGSMLPADILFRSASVEIPATTPVGTTLTATAEISSAATDAVPGNNTSQDVRDVTAALDPNEKRVLPASDLLPQGLLSYHIDFQNVGNDTAFTVVICDTLEANLDMVTVIEGAASDPYVLTKQGRELRWTFANIALPDSSVDEPGSKGFVQFQVRPVAGLPNTTVLSNGAAIYFDYNAPVITNVATTTFLGNPTAVGDLTPTNIGEIHLQSAPNPFNPQTTIAFSLPARAQTTLRIYDVAGRLVRVLLDEVRPAGANEVRWDGADGAGRAVASGSYFVRLEAGGRHAVRPLALVR